MLGRRHLSNSSATKKRHAANSFPRCLTTWENLLSSTVRGVTNHSTHHTGSYQGPSRQNFYPIRVKLRFPLQQLGLSHNCTFFRASQM